MTPLTCGSCDTASAAAAISDCTCAFNAFIGGRSSLIVATASLTSTRTNSAMPASRLAVAACPQSSPSGRSLRVPRAPRSYARSVRTAPVGAMPEGLPARSGQALRHGTGSSRLLADSVWQVRALPPGEQAAHLGLAVAAVAAGRPNRGELATPGPSRHGLRVDPKHGRYLGRGEEPVVRLDLSSHSCGSSRCYFRNHAVTDSHRSGHYSLKSTNHRMSHVRRFCWRSHRQGDKFRRSITAGRH